MCPRHLTKTGYVISFRKEVIMTETGKPLTPGDGTKPKLERCTIVSYPKVVFFYPLLFASIICGILENVSPEKSEISGSIFLFFFLFNMLVISFDFPGVRALVIVFASLAIVFGLILLQIKYKIEILGFITRFYKENIHANLDCSAVFYYCISAILAVMIGAGILGNWLWNRWTIEPNRLVHRKGLLGELKEYPVIDLQIDKRIDDVFEYVLLLSGTLTFQPGPGVQPIVLENIPLVNRKEKRIQNIVRKFAVTRGE